MKITRRKLLRELAAVPVMIAGSEMLGCQGQTGSHTDNEKLPTTSSPMRSNGAQYLNLILHGLFAVIVHGDENPSDKNPGEKNAIEIWVPNADHVYEWGNWRTEGKLVGSGATYTIPGILGGAQSLDKLEPLNNAVMKQGCPLHPLSQVKPYCSFSLPFPEEIYSVRKVCKRPHTAPFITGEAAGYLQQQPDNISMVHVFRYTISSPEALSSYGGVRPLVVDRKTGMANLHIWADPVDATHMGRALDFDEGNTPFDLMVESITGLKCQQPKMYHRRIGGLNVLEHHPGVHHYEKYNRGERKNWPDEGVPHVTLCTSERREMDTRIVHCMALFMYHPKLTP